MLYQLDFVPLHIYTDLYIHGTQYKLLCSHRNFLKGNRRSSTCWDRIFDDKCLVRHLIQFFLRSYPKSKCLIFLFVYCLLFLVQLLLSYPHQALSILDKRSYNYQQKVCTNLYPIKIIPKLGSWKLYDYLSQGISSYTKNDK